MARSKSDRRSSFFKGMTAEYIAALWLILHGYRLVHRRFQTKSGEIDLIARRGALTIFVEVKARKEIQMGIDSVTYETQNRIKAASDIWLSKQQNAQLLSQRYDIIVVVPWKLPQHFIDAF